MANYYASRDLVKPLISDDEFHAWNFLFRPLFDDSEAEAALAIVQKSVVSIHQDISEKQRIKKNNRNNKRIGGGAREQNKEEICCVEDTVELESLTPRDYQMKYFHLVKNENIIAHLGTGFGKTVIAMLATKFFLEHSSNTNFRQVLFLVPTKALTEQHTRNFKRNILTSSYSIRALNGSSYNPNDDALQKIANADVLISTHGALLDLYRHHRDLFCLRNVCLLIFDECHHVMAGNHGYSQFMDEIYWKEPHESRPRVLGLTASPCFNFDGKDDLQIQIDDIQKKLNSKIISVNDLGTDDREADDGTPSMITKSLPEQSVQERIIDFVENSTFPFIDDSTFQLAKIRKAEIKSLKKVYECLGPLPTSVYCGVVLREISRARNDGETAQNFDSMKLFLEKTQEYCKNQCIRFGNNGRSDKLIKLEDVISKQVGVGGDNRSIIFVDMRIVAVALYCYLNQTFKTKDTLSVRSDFLVRRATHIFKYLAREHHSRKLGSRHEKSEWVHVMRSDEEVLDKLRDGEIDLLIATSAIEEGVDVPACSCVIMFDGISSFKAYKQMKGRARSELSTLYVFCETSSKRKALTLSCVQERDQTLKRYRVEQIIQTDSFADCHRAGFNKDINNDNNSHTHSDRNLDDEESRQLEFIQDNHDRKSLSESKEVIVDVDQQPFSMEEKDKQSKSPLKLQLVCCNFCKAQPSLTRNTHVYNCVKCNEELLRKGEYKVGPVYLNLTNSRSILNTYLQWMSKKKAFKCSGWKDFVEGRTFILPHRLSKVEHIVSLPEIYSNRNKADRQRALSFLACVRLHQLGAINDRLEPNASIDSFQNSSRYEMIDGNISTAHRSNVIMDTEDTYDTISIHSDVTETISIQSDSQDIISINSDTSSVTFTNSNSAYLNNFQGEGTLNAPNSSCRQNSLAVSPTCQYCNEYSNGIIIFCQKCNEFILRKGEYNAGSNKVNLSTGKSILNSYIQYSNKLGDTDCYNMKDMLSQHHFTLPAHICENVRTVLLPEFYFVRNKTDRHRALAFLTCVRLHQLKLLDDNLKPISTKASFLLIEEKRSVCSQIYPPIKGNIDNEIQDDISNSRFIYVACKGEDDQSMGNRFDRVNDDRLLMPSIDGAFDGVFMTTSATNQDSVPLDTGHDRESSTLNDPIEEITIKSDTHNIESTCAFQSGESSLSAKCKLEQSIGTSSDVDIACPHVVTGKLNGTLCHDDAGNEQSSERTSSELLIEVSVNARALVGHGGEIMQGDVAAEQNDVSESLAANTRQSNDQNNPITSAQLVADCEGICNIPSKCDVEQNISTTFDIDTVCRHVVEGKLDSSLSHDNVGSELSSKRTSDFKSTELSAKDAKTCDPFAPKGNNDNGLFQYQGEYSEDQFLNRPCKQASDRKRKWIPPNEIQYEGSRGDNKTSKTTQIDNFEMTSKTHGNYECGDERKETNEIKKVVYCHSCQSHEDEGVKISCHGCDEMFLKNGEYNAGLAYANLFTAKALFNVYIQHVNNFGGTQYVVKDMLHDFHMNLPSHIQPKDRVINLPHFFHCKSKNERQKALSFLACIRLHKLKVLNDHLRPVSAPDVLESKLATKLIPTIPKRMLRKTETLPESIKCWVLPINQAGEVFDRHNERVNPLRRKLGILSLEMFPPIEAFRCYHSELEYISCSMESPQIIFSSNEQLNICRQFMRLVIHRRWMRSLHFDEIKFKEQTSLSNIEVASYHVICLNDLGEVDFEYMNEVAHEYQRSIDERTIALANRNSKIPRVWNPVYKPNLTLIAYKQSDLVGKDDFPENDDGHKTYSSYYGTKYDIHVPELSPLFIVHRNWKYQTTATLEERKMGKRQDKWIVKSKDITHKAMKNEEGFLIDIYPSEACMEASIADPMILLHLIFIPSILHKVEMVAMAEKFRSYCSEVLPVLGTFLSQSRIEIPNIVESLTSLNASTGVSYDIYEYIGDAVLKVAHTDALFLCSNTTPELTSLHEGDLTILRAELGSNDRFFEVSKSLNFDKFIITDPLGRGKWIPFTIEDITGRILQNGGRRKMLPIKMIADIVESIVGLVYIHFDFDAALKVMDEMGVSVPTSGSFETKISPFQGTELGQNKALAFLGYPPLKNEGLLSEALTHPSVSGLPSYQKLEWVGDAVLCLAVRKVLRNQFPTAKVGSLNIFEVAIVNNETLGYLTIRSGLHMGAIYYDNCELRESIDSFAEKIKKDGCIWSGSAPKCLADVTESLIGATHVDGGLERSEIAANHIVHRLVQAIQANVTVTSLKKTELLLMHPKQQMCFYFEQSARYLSASCLPISKYFEKYGDSYNLIKSNKESTDENNQVGYITLHDVLILAVTGNNANFVVNKACGLMAYCAAKNPNLKKTIRTACFTRYY